LDVRFGTQRMRKHDWRTMSVRRTFEKRTVFERKGVTDKDNQPLSPHVKLPPSRQQNDNRRLWTKSDNECRLENTAVRETRTQ
jgi:hypothetical protein